MTFDARRVERRCTVVTGRAKLVRKMASSMGCRRRRPGGVPVLEEKNKPQQLDVTGQVGGVVIVDHLVVELLGRAPCPS
jgi:hypothetical protein